MQLMSERVGPMALCAATALLISACAPGARRIAVGVHAPPAADAPASVDYQGLHNVVTYADQLYSGSAPEGSTGFDSLVELGVRTVLSVDGARPDVEAARARGLRYVHLPIGYDGMTEARKLEIARALKELPRPIYVHCHHGKHRGAAALAAAGVALGKWTVEQALRRMKVSGTSPSYTGLFRCVSSASPVSSAELEAADGAFPEIWKTSGLVSTMVEMDVVFELLKLIDKADWSTPADHPDLVPAAEAGRLADLYRLLQANERCRRRPAEFQRLLSEASAAAAALEADILAGAERAELALRFELITAQCRDCHRDYRDR